MHKSGYVIYVDGIGKTHEALVRAINGHHPSYITLAYVDEKLDERDNVVTVYDVAHKDDASRADVRTVVANGPGYQGTTVQDGNPELPHFDVNVWMERDEEHVALPDDHPAFDHPHALPEYDQQGNRIPVVRTEYEKAIAEHQSALKAIQDGGPTSDGTINVNGGPLPTGADLDADAAEKAAKEATKPGIRVVKGSKGK